jgi:hypothetical protein
VTTDHAASVTGVALRVTRLDATGAPIVGASNSFVTNAFMSMGFTPEYTEGDEVEEKGADGGVCVYYKLPDTLKRVTFELAICAPDPELTEILVGGTILSTGGSSFTVTNEELTANVATLTIGTHTLNVGDTVTVAMAPADPIFDGSHVITAKTSTTISFAKTNADITSAAASGTVTGPTTVAGWAAPTSGVESTPNGVGLEVWSRAIVGGKIAQVNPFWRWIFPYAQMKLDGTRTLENGMMANTFAGWGLGNAAFGDGPQNDWPYSSDRAYQYARAASFPTGINGYQTVLADA